MNGDEFLQRTIKIRRLRWKLDDISKIIMPKDRNEARMVIVEQLPAILDDMIEILSEAKSDMFGFNIWSAMAELKRILFEVKYRVPERKIVNIEDLLKPSTQERIRYYMSKIRVEKGMTCKQVCEESDSGYSSLHEFLIRGKLVGKRQIVKYAHFVFKYGYRLEE